ncbi:hypothetical protein FF38_04863, partial [Lucilia cuprina]
MCIEKCYVNGLETTFNHFDLLSTPPKHPTSWDGHQYSLYEQKLAPLMQQVGPGELTIKIPESVEIKEPDANTFIASHSTKEKTYEPLTVRVDYHLLDGPNEGLSMIGSDGPEPHCYTTHNPIVDPNTGNFIVYGLADYDIWDNPSQKQFITDVVNEIHKLQRLDRWLPSRHYIITTTALKMGNLLISAGYGEPRMDKLLLNTKPEEAEEVRLTATDLLLDLGGYKNETVMNYLIEMMLNGTSSAIRSGLLKSLVRLVGHTGINGEFPTEGTSPMSLRQHALARKSINNSLPLLRKSLGSETPFTGPIWKALVDKRTGSLER